MKDAINANRTAILSLEQNLLSLKSSIATADLTTRPDVQPDLPAADRGEMIANITLAYRHLEDARMRLGKVIQAYEGGVSIYDRQIPFPGSPPVGDNPSGNESATDAAPQQAS